MDCTVSEIDLKQLKTIWQDTSSSLDWEPLFLLPPWLGVWYQVFTPGEQPVICVVKQAGELIGIAPLLIGDGTASLIGSPDVCDYLDFVTAPGKEAVFFTTLLHYMKKRGITTLVPGVVRYDSKVMTGLVPAAAKLGCRADIVADEVSLEMVLPSTWEEYLGSLDGKQRHEVRRKLRRLEEVGDIHYRFITDNESVASFMDVFLRMFVESRQDKANFLTRRMETYFRTLALEMAKAAILYAGVLELDGVPVATVFAFDYRGTVYLYNSGYDPRYRHLSAGVLSKALLIKDSIARGRQKFDFLKGDERYKYHLGGKEVKLNRCCIRIM